MFNLDSLFLTQCITVLCLNQVMLIETEIQRTPGQMWIRWVDWISVYLSEPPGPDVDSLG